MDDCRPSGSGPATRPVSTTSARTISVGHKLADVDGLDGFVDAASQIIEFVEGASLPLFTAMRAEPVPEDAPAAAMHQAMVLRELRGSVHLLALVAQGLDTAKAHAIKRPDDVAVFGYESAPEISPTRTAPRGSVPRR